MEVMLLVPTAKEEEVGAVPQHLAMAVMVVMVLLASEVLADQVREVGVLVEQMVKMVLMDLLLVVEVVVAEEELVLIMAMELTVE